MNLKIAICDDEQAQIEYISGLVSEWGKSNSHVCRIESFPSAEAFLFASECDPAYDILLLDVEMKAISGIELAKRLRKDNNRSEIIFITSHYEFAGEGYEVDALHYLIKPIIKEKLEQVLTKASEKLSVEPPSVIFTSSGNTVKLYESDIYYAESFLHYISIRTYDAEYKVKESISSFEARLSEDFIRTHRSYIVNLRHIIRISRTDVTLENRAVVPLARGKYDIINRAFILRN